jgi:hypothetical protein
MSKDLSALSSTIYECMCLNQCGSATTEVKSHEIAKHVLLVFLTHDSWLAYKQGVTPF